LRTPGIPRTADGKPNLTAPVPRTLDGKPDVSGTWAPETNPCRFDLIRDPRDESVFRPAAEAVFLERVKDFRRGDPGRYRQIYMAGRSRRVDRSTVAVAS
jgi:hypothetical protein